MDKVLKTILIGSVVSIGCCASAQTTQSPDHFYQYEKEVWQRMYEGTLDSQPVCLYLERFGNSLKGGAWPKEQECAQSQTPNMTDGGRFRLMGSFDNGNITLMHADNWGDGAPNTRWKLTETRSDDNKISVLNGAKEKDAQELYFRQQLNVSDMPAMPYRTTITIQQIFSDKPATSTNDCALVYNIPFIHVYQGEQLIQSLETVSHRESRSTECMLMLGAQDYRDPGPYLPEVVDINGDGYGDIRIITSYENGITHYQYWIYDPVLKRFATEPQTQSEQK